MLVLNAMQIRALVPMPALIDALRDGFCSGAIAPPRQVAPLPGSTGDRLFLTMPAFARNGAGVVKLVSVLPDNPARGLPTIQGAIVVFAETGEPVALLDAAIVTQFRTSAASALASTYLSRPNSRSLVIIGTGALAPFMALAHASVRPLHAIAIYGRAREKAERACATARQLLDSGLDVRVCTDLKAAVEDADIVCCATSSATPVFSGAWLRPGAHVDLVGSFTPDKRECDDDAIRLARLFVDTFEGALSEAGDIVSPLRRGIVAREAIEAELADLITGRAIGRRHSSEITLFKSVGAALEDLVAAQLILRLCQPPPS